MRPRVQQLIVLPDTDGELTALLDWLNDVLSLLGAFEDEDTELLPLPLAGRRALRSVQALRRLVAAAEHEPPAQPVTADGRELVPLLFLRLDGPGFGATLAAIAALVSSTDPTIFAVLGELERQMVNPLAALGRLANWLRIPADRDAEVLSVLLAAGHGRVVLDRTDEAAYWRIADRARCTLWSPADPLAWFLFRGR